MHEDRYGTSVDSISYAKKYIGMIEKIECTDIVCR